MRTEKSLRIVLDSSSLIILAKLDILEKITNIFGEIEIPRGVLDEIARKKDKVYVALNKLINEDKVCVENIKKKLPKLGLGESSVIFLALTKNKVLVLDDKKARKLARDLGLDVIGVLSIFKIMYERGIIKEPPNILYRRLIELGFYIDKDIFDKIIKAE